MWLWVRNSRAYLSKGKGLVMGRGEGRGGRGEFYSAAARDKRDDAPDYNAPGTHPLLTF